MATTDRLKIKKYYSLEKTITYPSYNIYSMIVTVSSSSINGIICLIIRNLDIHAVLEIRICVNQPNSMKIPKSCFKLDHFSTNFGKTYKRNQDLNWPNSILIGLGRFLPPNFAHCTCI